MAADFTTGQAARAVIGQRTFTVAEANTTPSNWQLGAVSGLAYANDTLFVADSNRVGAAPINNRVLIYHDILGQFPPPEQERNQNARCPVCGGQASAVLGQPDFKTIDPAAAATGMSLPTAVATDGTVLAVADTDNNRVLIWKTIPTTNTKPADIVVGQPDFTTTATLVPPTAKSLRGPQGVWIQGGKLYVADTQDHRVLIYNSIPTSNGAAADVVLGQPNFTTFVEPDLTQAKSDATANNLLNPVSVTSDGVRLYVADLGHNRVLIWNSLPTENQRPADVVLGQPNMTSSIPDYSFTGAAATSSTDTTNKETPVMCTKTNGTDLANHPTYPPLCNTTMSFPRYALSDGNWLFVADGGNDRVLVYGKVPTTNGAAADLVLGQADDITDVASPDTDRLQTPMSLAWDGTNLYVGDTYNRRVVIYSPAEPIIAAQGVRNAASLEVFAVGSVTFGGTINATDAVTVTIGTAAGTVDYKYTVVKSDTFDNVVNALVNSINTADSGKGDPNVIAQADTAAQSIVLTARKGGTDGNNVTLAATVSASAKITATASGANLSGGQNTAQVAPGTLITIYAKPGTTFTDTTAVDPGTGPYLPSQLGTTRVYIDGARAPLLYVSPTQINAQIPTGYVDASSVSLYVWTQHADGSVTVTTPVAVNIVPENPGIFATGTQEPRPAVMSHTSPYATGSVQVDGTPTAGDVGTITIGGKAYAYTVLSTDTDLAHITTGLVNTVNADPDRKVEASAATVFTRVLLRARTAGKAGSGITYSATVSSGAKLLLTPSSSALCCANTGMVTSATPAIPGETITIYATGLGTVTNMAKGHFRSGFRYPNNEVTTPVEFVSSLAGGKTANVIEASPLPGSVGIFEVQLELNTSLTTDPQTQLTIAQFTYVSNIVTFPVKKP
ncbi:MAG: hypothetical protein LAP39_15960 [Acidobacteriia bacterium]|nr:hypothetical protein [Terriglobia bacterium]